ncbi:MAG: SH3 domain-containing protein [Candidatus Flexifilum sp.]|jgi:uncharacterized protein YraI
MKSIIPLGVLLLSAALTAHAQPTAQTLPPTPTAPASLSAVVVSTTNIRSGADTRFPIIGRAAAGETVTLIGRDAAGRWLVIEREPLDGWIPFFSVRADGDPLALPVFIPDADDPTEGGPTAYAYGLINVRARPSISAEVIGQLDAGTTVRITGRSSLNNDWLLIAADEDDADDPLTGWVAYFTVRVSGSLDDLPILGTDFAGRVIVPAEQIAEALFNVRLRAAPSTDAATLLIVPFGAAVAPIARSADDAWIYFGYNDVFGWGALNLFRIDPDALTALPVFDVTLSAAPTAEQTPEPTEPPGAGGP